MQLLHAQYSVKFIVVCQTIKRAVCPRGTPSYNDRVDLLNRYLSVVLETLPFATFWCHKGLRKPSVPMLCRDGVHLNHNMLSIGVTGVPFYALLGLFRFHCHPRRISLSRPQLILGCGYSPLLRFKHMHTCLWNLCSVPTILAIQHVPSGSFAFVSLPNMWPF